MIKQAFWVAALMAAWAVVGQAETGQVYVVAGLTAYDGAKTFQVVSTNAFAELVRDAKLDNEALPKAYANLRKAWRDAHAQKDGQKQKKGPPRDEALPIACPPPREVRQLGLFSSAGAADKELRAHEAQEAARVKREEDAQERPAVPALPDSGLKRPPVHAPKNRAKEPDAALQQSTLKALIDEIATVRAAIAASHDAAAASAPPAPVVHAEKPSKHKTKK